MFTWLFVHTVTTAATAVVVAAACRWFRLGPAARHLLWLVVLVKLLIPPIVYWPWALPTFGGAPAPLATALPAGPAPTVPARVVVIDEEPVADRAAAAVGEGPAPETAANPVAPPAQDSPSPSPYSWDWLPTAAAWVWLTGAILVAARNALRILRWRRRLARGLPASQGLTEMVHDEARAMGVRPPRLVVLSGVASPMVWGFGAPRLIWPLGLEERLSAEGRRAVVLHELAHLRRRDHWVGWLLLAAGCAWWWHPLFWWARRRLTAEAELACDAWVVGAAPDVRRAYAEALLEVSQRVASTAAVPALGAAGGRRDLERRLIMIMRGPAPRRLSRVGLASVGVLGLLALPAWTLGGDPRTPPAPTPAGPSISATPAVNNPFGSGLVAPAPAPVAAPPGDAATPPAADGDRDKRIRDLEEKVGRLLKEIQELRGQSPAGPSKGPADPTAPDAAQFLIDSLISNRLAATAPVRVAPAAAETPGEVITLTRVSYKLKAQTAEALAAFLKDNVKTAILETKAEGETLTVTTTPDAQDAIGEFIGLIQGKTKPRAGMMGPMGGPPMGMPGPGSTGFYPPGGGPLGPSPGGTSGPPGFGPVPGGTGGRGFGGFPGSGGTPPPGATVPPPGSTPFPPPGGTR